MSALRDEDERTVFLPEDSSPPEPETKPTEAVVPEAEAIRAELPPTGRVRGTLATGTLLNNIYSVRRFLARGGMGEVYEGVNVNTDERVAIKVMLPHLAADPKVQAMFRKEARILTELAHPALVRYRVLAHEPRYDLFYIVTEFIDGRSLSDMLGELKPSTRDLAGLMQRLAEGLAAAHRLGAVHRDISPDNVLLPQGRLDQAKIIDFGIARENNLAHQTVVGDGFAGKLGYVAPEQFGDFGRRIGPWTDVYSLGLVGLALAGARAPDMGVTLVDAVDRRREGVDLGPVPAVLKPIFEKMLAPDPTNRFQSMDPVIAAFNVVTKLAPAAIPARPSTPAEALAQVPPPETPEKAPAKWGLYAAAACVALLVATGVAVMVASRPAQKAGPLQSSAAVEPAVATPAIPEAVALAEEPAAPPADAPPTETLVAPAPVKPAARPRAAAPVALAAPTVQQIVAPTPIAAAPQISTPAPAQADAAPAAAESQASGVEACWRAVDGAWTYIGYASRGSCVAQAFNSCSVVHGRWGKTQMRRYDGKLQAKGTGILAKWQAVGTSQCPATAPGAAP